MLKSHLFTKNLKKGWLIMLKKLTSLFLLMFVFSALFTPVVEAKDYSSGNTATWVFIPGKLSYPVSGVADQVVSDWEFTQLESAQQIGSYGFFAHRERNGGPGPGSSLVLVVPGDLVLVTFSDGSSKGFVVKSVSVEKKNPNKDLFSKYYKRGTLTFQTCEPKDGNGEWGYLFVIAVPLQ
jgi:hypothetical protein